MICPTLCSSRWWFGWIQKLVYIKTTAWREWTRCFERGKVVFGPERSSLWKDGICWTSDNLIYDDWSPSQKSKSISNVDAITCSSSNHSCTQKKKMAFLVLKSIWEKGVDLWNPKSILSGNYCKPWNNLPTMEAVIVWDSRPLYWLTSDILPVWFKSTLCNV